MTKFFAFKKKLSCTPIQKQAAASKLSDPFCYEFFNEILMSASEEKVGSETYTDLTTFLFPTSFLLLFVMFIGVDFVKIWLSIPQVLVLYVHVDSGERLRKRGRRNEIWWSMIMGFLQRAKDRKSEYLMNYLWWSLVNCCCFNAFKQSRSAWHFSIYVASTNDKLKGWETITIL